MLQGIKFKTMTLCLLCQSVWGGDRLTIYNDGLALVQESRSVQLQAGVNHLELSNVSGEIQPETVTLDFQKPVHILEQNFDYHLLQEEALLNHYVGQEVWIVDAEGQGETATLLANNGAPILRYADRIESRLPPAKRIVFPRLPEGLKQRPTLSVDVEAKEQGESALQLRYLSRGFSWKADYVAHLQDDALDLTAWLTLSNSSQKDFEQAQIQLVAGEVNTVQPERRATYALEVPVTRRADAVQQEALLDYHLYSLPRPTSLKHYQSKQINLFDGLRLPASRHYVYQSRNLNSRHLQGEERQSINLELQFEAKEALPAGIVRVYSQDSQGQAQFVGEDRIGHRAAGEKLRLQLGTAFDVYVLRTLLSQKRLDLGLNNKSKFEQQHRLVFHNRKDEAVRIEVQEEFHSGDWKITASNLPAEKTSAFGAQWMVDVPPRGEALLEYSVRISE